MSEREKEAFVGDTAGARDSASARERERERESARARGRERN